MPQVSATMASFSMDRICRSTLAPSCGDRARRPCRRLQFVDRHVRNIDGSPRPSGSIGGSDTYNRVVNSGLSSGSDHEIIGPGGSDFIRNSGEISCDIDLGFGNDVFDGRRGATMR